MNPPNSRAQLISVRTDTTQKKRHWIWRMEKLKRFFFFFNFFWNFPVFSNFFSVSSKTCYSYIRSASTMLSAFSTLYLLVYVAETIQNAVSPKRWKTNHMKWRRFLFGSVWRWCVYVLLLCYNPIRMAVAVAVEHWILNWRMKQKWKISYIICNASVVHTIDFYIVSRCRCRCTWKFFLLFIYPRTSWHSIAVAITWHSVSLRWLQQQQPA